ncbi:MAG: hypothetical protein HZB25_12970 [Candidatus Eisenbacteria bacterium]|nr:hypothetical protein [Candidatus Eisenbacteria bacterium]
MNRPALRAARAASFLGVSSVIYAALSAWHAPYDGFLCVLATPLLRFLSGEANSLGWMGDGIGCTRAGDGRVFPLGDLSALWAQLPIYLGLCATAPRRALAHAAGLGAGVAGLICLQVVTITLFGILACWQRSRPGVELVAAAYAVLTSLHWVAPAALWLVQFPPGIFGSANSRPRKLPLPR